MKKHILLTVGILLISNLKGHAAGFNFSHFKIPNGEQLTLQSKDALKGTFSKWINTVTDTMENNLPIYRVKNGNDAIIKFCKKDLTPILFHRWDENENTLKTIEYYGNEARIIIPREDIDRTIHVESDTYDGWTLFYLFRALLFDLVDEKVNFSLIKETPYHGIRVVEMVVQVVGEENVVVPAGTFSCYKVELGVAGLIGLFWPVKYHYYFTKNDPHYFVKYVDPEGECMELLKYEILNESGK
jgi:hypothetical protein